MRRTIGCGEPAPGTQIDTVLRATLGRLRPVSGFGRHLTPKIVTIADSRAGHDGIRDWRPVWLRRADADRGDGRYGDRQSQRRSATVGT
jgi:hypothetical protein